MTGIDIADTIVVRRTVEKGTRVIEEPAKKLNWTGTEFKKFEKEKRQLAGKLSLASSKGTSRLLLSKLKETQIPSLKGIYPY